VLRLWVLKRKSKGERSCEGAFAPPFYLFAAAQLVSLLRRNERTDVLGRVKTRATLCLLRLHLRKSRNSKRAIVVISLYPSAVAQRTQGLAELGRVEDRRIDPPHTPRDGLCARNDAAFEQEPGVRRADGEMASRTFRGEPRRLRGIAGRQFESTAELAHAQSRPVIAGAGAPVSFLPIVRHTLSPSGGQAFSPEWGPPVFG